MGITESIKRIVTGKNEVEREQERAANAEIKRKQLAAYYEAKQKESIKLAQTKARYEREAKEKRLKTSYSGGGFWSAKPTVSPFGGGVSSVVGNSFGNTSFHPLYGSRTIATAPRKPKVRRKRARATRTRIVYRNAPRQPMPSAFRVI